MSPFRFNVGDRVRWTAKGLFDEFLRGREGTVVERRVLQNDYFPEGRTQYAVQFDSDGPGPRWAHEDDLGAGRPPVAAKVTKEKIRALAALAAHPDTPEHEANAAAMALAKIVDRGLSR